MLDYNSITINCHKEQESKRYAYEKAIEAYWKHVDRYHTWMNYYAIFSGALFVGFCTLLTATTIIEPEFDTHLLFSLKNTYGYLQLIISIIGLISSICWTLSIIGHEKWEHNWINIIELFEGNIVNTQKVYSILCTEKAEIIPETKKGKKIEKGIYNNAFSTHFVTKVFVFSLLVGWLILITYCIVEIINLVFGILLFCISFATLIYYFKRYIGFGNIYSNIIGKVWMEKISNN